MLTKTEPTMTTAEFVRHAKTTAAIYPHRTPDHWRNWPWNSYAFDDAGPHYISSCPDGNGCPNPICECVLIRKAQKDWMAYNWFKVNGNAWL